MPRIAPKIVVNKEVLLLLAAAGTAWGLWMAGFANFSTRSWGTALPSSRASCAWRSVGFLHLRDVCDGFNRVATPGGYRRGPTLEKLSGGN